MTGTKSADRQRDEMAKLELTCVGMNYRVTAQTRREMERFAPLRIEIRREPENKKDENALAIYCLDKPWQGMHIGYLPRAVAADFAPLVDEGMLSFEGGILASVDADAGNGEITVTARKLVKAKRK